VEAEKEEKEFGQAEDALNNHGVIAFPTETVMGLAVYYDDVEAYNKLNQIKRRPEDKPYTMMVKDKKEIANYAIINEVTQRVIDAFMPGSITILVPVKADSVPTYVTHNTGVIGIRIPTNKEAVELLNAIDKPLLVPSANRSGEKPAQ
jgi:L-threonylcarbamoyladenylate synthase